MEQEEMEKFEGKERRPVTPKSKATLEWEANLNPEQKEKYENLKLTQKEIEAEAKELKLKEMKYKEILFVESLFKFEMDEMKAFAEVYPSSVRGLGISNGKGSPQIAQIIENLLNSPRVIYLINKKLDQRTKSSMITREKILNELNDIYKMNKTKNPGIAIKSLEQMSKLLGLDLVVDKFGSRGAGGDAMNIQINYVTPQNNNNDNTNIIPLE
jgi:hypothetical protein